MRAPSSPGIGIRWKSMSERFASMNASAIQRTSPVTPVRSTSPPIAASARFAIGPGQRRDDRVPRAVAEVAGVDRRGLPVRDRRRQERPPGTPTARGSSPGSNPLPNGSNHTFGLNVSRPHNRGVGSWSRAATNARAYSRALMPISSDAAR